jgi:small subunit ribosomal protein S2
MSGVFPEGYAPLVPEDDYLAAGAHIGTHQRSHDMERFIHKVREDGVALLQLHQTDLRLRAAAKFLARVDAGKIMAVSARQYGATPVQKFAQATGSKASIGRFIPGTLTNPNLAVYDECQALVVSDPVADAQPLTEAFSVGVPIIAFCHTASSLQRIDLAIPANNKGRKSLALLYYLMAREVRRARGWDEMTLQLKDFEAESPPVGLQAPIQRPPEERRRGRSSREERSGERRSRFADA